MKVQYIKIIMKKKIAVNNFSLQQYKVGGSATPNKSKEDT